MTELESTVTKPQSKPERIRSDVLTTVRALKEEPNSRIVVTGLIFIIVVIVPVLFLNWY